MNTADQFVDLSRAVRRLSPDRRDPERYLVDKDAIAKALVCLARQMEQAA
jgi:hypothetical protein